MVGGNVLAALIHPVLLGSFAYPAVTGYPILIADGPPIALMSLFATSLIAGYVISISLGVRGLAGRGLLTHVWALVLVLVHWPLLSVAAWRAGYQLVRDPQGWEKTEHGLAKNSRRAQMKNATTRDVAPSDERQRKLRSAA